VTLTGNLSVFPNNIVEVLATNLQFIDTDLTVVKRRVYSTDPPQTVGASSFIWQPDEGSYEFRGPDLAGVPTISRYDVNVQCMIRDLDQIRGGAAHAELTALARRMVLGDSTLGGSLRALVSNIYGVPERLRRWHIQSTRYLSEEVEGPQSEFVYLSTTTVRFETET
jgi:hypothetical protein